MQAQGYTAASCKSRAPGTVDMGIGIDYQQVIKGLVLLAAVIFDVYNKQKQR